MSDLPKSTGEPEASAPVPCSAIDALEFAIELCHLRKSASRTVGWNAACDDLSVFLQAAHERLTANLPLREYATTQNAKLSHEEGGKEQL